VLERVGPRRFLLITALGAAALVGAFAVQNLASSTVYYLTPSEAKARGIAVGQTARLGGLVEAGSLRYDERSRELRLVITDGNASVDVVGNAASAPALLREGAGAVVEGAFAADGTFHATQVIAKHDEVYMPPATGTTPPHRTAP
jgi:cytochrome c-type biogenesis protein CcmE